MIERAFLDDSILQFRKLQRLAEKAIAQVAYLYISPEVGSVHFLDFRHEKEIHVFC